MPTTFLTEEQHAAYGDYTGDPEPPQLAKFFHLDDVDLQRVRRHNGSHHRLGFALQLGTVRFLGTFLANPIAVPPIVIDFMARQLAIPTTRTLDRYLEREDTKWEHAREICHDYGYHDQYVTISRLNAKIITGSLIGYAWGAIQPIRPRRTSDDRVDQFNQPACA